MLSNASQYAIRAVLYLEEKSSKSKKFGAKQIAEELEIPLAFIAKLLQKLAKEEVISSSKGPKGGFFMTPKNGKNTVCDIIDQIDKGDVFDRCFMGLPACSDANPCPVHHIVSPFKDKLLTKFKSQTISEFSTEIASNGSYLSLKGIDLTDIL